MSSEIEQRGDGRFKANDVDTAIKGSNHEDYSAEWIWDNLKAEQRRILVMQAFKKLGYKFEDTVDYTVLTWKDFPTHAHLTELQLALSEAIDEVRPV